LQVDFDKLSLTKSEFFEKMKQAGVNLQVHYIPVHLQPFYKQKYGFKSGDLPVAEKFYTMEISLPIYPDLSNDVQEKFIEILTHHISA
jgi:dTDP-4-amino-4,6-dideoxygalactose transaminase